MTQRELHFRLDPHYSIPEIFQRVGPPTQESTAYLRQRQKEIDGGTDPDYFYLLIRLVPRPEITRCWGWDRHLATGDGSLTHWQSLVEPGYRQLYNIFALSTYQVALRYAKHPAIRDAVHTINVPLKQSDGRSYAWFRQRAEPMQVDTDGKLISHLNRYHYVADFADLTAAGLRMHTPRGEGVQLTREINQHSQQVFNSILTDYCRLTPAAARVLDCFRRHWADKPYKEPKSEAIADELNITVAGVRKQNRAILESVGAILSLPDIDRVSKLARCLNACFGPPVVSA